jgi:hypothetical protein
MLQLTHSNLGEKNNRILLHKKRSLARDWNTTLICLFWGILLFSLAPICKIYFNLTDPQLKEIFFKCYFVYFAVISAYFLRHLWIWNRYQRNLMRIRCGLAFEADFGELFQI